MIWVPLPCLRLGDRRASRLDYARIQWATVARPLSSVRLVWTLFIGSVCESGARQAIFEYLEVFNNRKRRHSALGILTPAQYDSLSR
jgi:hypothetical protein